MSVYVLIAMLRKRMKLEHLSLWQIPLVLSLTCFEKRPVHSLFLYENDDSRRSSDRQTVQLSFIYF
jgi:hypothetical protein